MFNRVPSKIFAPLLAKSAGTITAFILSVFLARVLGVEEFGAYSLVISTVMVLAIPVQSGLPTLATREVARSQAANHKSTIHLYIAWSNRIIILYFSFTSILAVLFLLAFPEYDFTLNVFIAILSIITIAVTLRNCGVLRGLGHFVVGSVPDVLMRPAVQLAAFIALFHFAKVMAQQAPWALVTFVSASAFACGMSVFWLRAALPKKSPPVNGEDYAKIEPWGKAALLLTVVGGGQIFFGHIDTLMLGLLGDEKEVGAYRVAVQLSMLVIFALAVVNQVLQPKISELHAQSDMERLQKLLADSSLLMFLATLLPALVAAAIAPQLLGFVFGEEYRVAASALQILILGQAINVFFGSVGTILNMTGLEKLAMRGMVIAILVNIGLDVLLIPSLGLTGAALASALTLTIWNAILRYYVKDRLGIESSGVIAYTHRLLDRNRSI